jgi:hypothetical protein
MTNDSDLLYRAFQKLRQCLVPEYVVCLGMPNFLAIWVHLVCFTPQLSRLQNLKFLLVYILVGFRIF